MVKRDILDRVRDRFFKGKVIILTGPRQVGKTTLMAQLSEGLDGGDILVLNCDEPDVRLMLENVTSTVLKSIIGRAKVVLIDEAQRVNNIGLTLKLIVDNIKDVQVVATGSSAFDLRNRLNEPLTGRKFEYHLFPFSTNEMIEHTSALEESRLLERRMVYGM